MKNYYSICDDTVTITLNGRNPKETTVSKRHLRKLLQLNVTWYAIWHDVDNTFYAVCFVKQPDGSRKRIRLHRYLTDCSDKQYVLHLDNDGLNNVDSNLLVTDRNRTGAKRERQLDVGVGFDLQRIMWYAVVEVNGERQFIGYFLSEEAARDAFEQMNVQH